MSIVMVTFPWLPAVLLVSINVFVLPCSCKILCIFVDPAFPCTPYNKVWSNPELICLYVSRWEFSQCLLDVAFFCSDSGAPAMICGNFWRLRRSMTVLRSSTSRSVELSCALLAYSRSLGHSSNFPSGLMLHIFFRPFTAHSIPV